jgi:hypothetical protein
MIPIPIRDDNGRLVTGTRKTFNLDDPVEVSYLSKSYCWMHTGLVLTRLGKYALTFYNDHAGEAPKDFGVLVDNDTALVEIIQRDHAELLQYFINWIEKSSSFIPISKYFSVKCLKS